jgi:hypothetical protein
MLQIIACVTCNTSNYKDYILVTVTGRDCARQQPHFRPAPVLLVCNAECIRTGLCDGCLDNNERDRQNHNACICCWKIRSIDAIEIQQAFFVKQSITMHERICNHGCKSIPCQTWRRGFKLAWYGLSKRLLLWRAKRSFKYVGKS